ncbi:alanine aminotransferase 2 isoform X2 [Spodoptera frugiperda]|uniref:alanine transaminase n=1 Tax=Spodoptera frugiperda TaxID=7108 RepID=A0A9R0D8V3_SPOFR|nr:alanine aminotransferase 2 isoform X2 [Spodoptera frugiperda]
MWQSTASRRQFLPSWCIVIIRTKSQGSLTLENLNPNIIKLQYAVRGPLVIRAGALIKELAGGSSKPFNKVILANVGDAQAMKQQPITFIRQVVACASYPNLIKSGSMPADVKQRAKDILKSCAGQSVGAYTMSHGIELIRRHVAEYIEQRDGHKANWQDICLTAGASNGIKHVLELFCNKVDCKPTGIMIPIPQYPLYSATLTEFGIGHIRYYLDEDKGWALDINELERSFTDGSKTHAVRAIVVINPGNPTGQVLKRGNIEDIIKFAHKKNLLIFADEVYQANVYDKDSKFFSFKKVMTELGAPYSCCALASFMSISKGYTGECGLRGGWMELCNMDPKVQEHLYKAMSAMLCPPTIGQIVCDCVAKTPCCGEPSYELWEKERCAVLDSLKERSEMIVQAFNGMKGFKCNKVQGAMYAFPRIELSSKAVEAAKAAGKAPDVFYAFKLLEDCGICIVPGSGFGQKPGTYHFRTTILPQKPLLKEMLDTFQKFHQKFSEQYP